METKQNTKTVHLGHVSVDSGQVIIVDPSYIMDGEYDDAPVHNPEDCKTAGYGHPCEVTLSEERCGEFPVKGFATAVASSSGYGDGNYPAYGEINEDGRVIALHVYFDEDPNTGERSYTAQWAIDSGLKAQSDPLVIKIMDYMIDYDEDGQPESMSADADEAGFTAEDVIRLQDIFQKGV